jgi:MFS family permease
MVLCVGCIFFGSCAENGMGNWISGFMENALHIDKALGDVLGVAMFAVLLGLARILHSKFGGNILYILLIGLCGAAACYLIAAFCTNTIIVFAACILTGLFTAMLWPGALIMMEENVPGVSIAAYALMAAGGDLGASLSPQLMGIVVDQVSASSLGASLAVSTGLTVEQIGMKASMLTGALFPILGIVLMVITMGYFRKQKKL